MYQKVPWVLKDLNVILNSNSDRMPATIKNWYKNQIITKPSFRGELFYLRRLLTAERSKNYNKEKEFYRLLYIGLCNYYLGAYPGCKRFLDTALSLGVGKKIYPLIYQIKYSITKLPKILLIVAYEPSLSYNFKRVDKINNNIKVINNVSKYSVDKLFRDIKYYDQVFIIGHSGDEDEKVYLELGKDKITPNQFIKKLSNLEQLPKVFGIFACGEEFDISLIRNKFPYFLTDNIESIPEFIEMFFNGYLTEYYYSYNIHTSFNKGKLATIFRAKKSKAFKIYAGGTLLE